LQDIVVAITKKIKIVQKSSVFVRSVKKNNDAANQMVIKGSTTTLNKSVRKNDEDSSNPEGANCQGSFAKERILLALNTILEKEVENASSCVCPCIVGQTEERRDHREPNSIVEGVREERGMATAP
jgi:hypothetical protein